MRDQNSIPRVLVTCHRGQSRELLFNGNYFIDQPNGSDKSPCGYLGVANALQGDYRTLDRLQDPESVRAYDVILIAVSSLVDTEKCLEWVRKVRKWHPKAVLIGQPEASVNNHAIASRDWRFQKVYYDFCGSVDRMATFTEKTIPYFQLFAEKEVRYLPHFYPLHYIDAHNLAKSREEKQKILFKNGHVHGRLLADGFADLGALARVWRLHQDFRIALVNAPSSVSELLSELDYTSQSFDQLAVAKVVNRLSKRLNRSLSRIAFKISPDFRSRQSLKNEFPLVLRGLPSSAIMVRHYSPWRTNVQEIADSYLLFDLDYCFSVGRAFADAAAVGTPSIGVNSDFQAQLMPELSVGEHDYESAVKLALRLITEPKFHEHMAMLGRQRLEKYRYERSFEWLKSCIAEQWRWG